MREKKGDFDSSSSESGENKSYSDIDSESPIDENENAIKSSKKFLVTDL